MLLPRRHSDAAAGFDLVAAGEAAITLAPGGYAPVPTGIALEIPVGHEGQVRPRSGLAKKHGVTVLNAPGTIDADYRGEVQVLLINHGPAPFVVERGLRIAQLVIAPLSPVSLVTATQLTDTARGGGGFGSTGAEA